MIEALRLHTADGLELAAELFVPEVPVRAGMVLCHPHPLSGGTMRGVVIEALFGTLPGVAALRFDFRGVPGSDGQHDGGDTERLDVRAAVDVLDTRLPAAVPLVLAGWSFGADLALSTHPDRVAAWFAVAPPLHFLRTRRPPIRAPSCSRSPGATRSAPRGRSSPRWAGG